MLDLRVGEIVEVRSEAEILATLDENGELDGLPFMPEMLAVLRPAVPGRQARPQALRHHRLDRHVPHARRRAPGGVALRRPGARRLPGGLHHLLEGGLAQAGPRRTHRPSSPAPGPRRRCTLATLTAATRRPADPAAPGEERYACQATELLRAAPERIPSWDARQYVQDVRSGNAGALATIRTVAVGLFNEYQDLSRRLLPRPLRIRDGRRYPVHRGRLQKTPEETLDLQPGELVRVKSKEEIVKTLDTNNANRGMSFDGEMLRYCGREARVLRRVERIIDEKTGRMLQFKNPCIVLEDVTCTGAYHRQCPRGIYPYWREIWLERVE